MSCNITIDSTSIEKALKEYTGSNEILFTSYWNEIRSEHIDDYTSEFISLLKAKGINTASIPPEKYEDVIRTIREIYNKHNPSVNFDTKFDTTDSEVAKYGYSSIEARNEGMRHVVNFMLNVRYKLDNVFGEKFEGSKKQFYADQTINKFEDYLVDRLLTKFTEDEIWDAIEEGNFAQLDKMVASLNNIQTSNLFALYKEMLSNKENYFNYVFDNNSRLGDIKFEKNDNVDEDSTYEYAEQEEGEDSSENSNEDNNDSTDDVDKTTKRWDDKASTNYLKEVDSDVKSYLGSLKKLNSNHKDANGKRDENTDNLYGIADVMDIEDCCTVLYSEDIDYTSRETMMESIRNVANNIPGFQAFYQIYDDCKADDNLAFKLYNTFAKFVISKLETVSDGNRTISRTSNRLISKNTTLRFEFTNSVKTTALQNDDISSKALKKEIDNKLDILKDTIDDFNGIQGDDTFDVADRLELLNEIDILKKEIISDIASQLKRYYPTLESTAIANYVKNAHKQDFIENVNKLLNILTQTINGSFATQNAYQARALEIARAYEYNSKPENKNNKRNISEIYEMPYISKDTQTAAIVLANEMSKFTDVHTEYNSRNVHGNQSSDVINNSMITNLMNILKSTIATQNYGKYKSQTRQYDFSNIMVEHRNEHGQILNFGLFKLNEETGDFEPTSYAHRLLQARLFNGATDAVTSKNVLYSEMSKGDYVATSIINFFNVESTYKIETTDNIVFANYFMRIPSDAPKNFIITAPKYSATGLFNIENKSEINIEVNRRINNMVNSRFNDYGEVVQMMMNPIEVSQGQARHHLTARHPGAIKVKSSQLNESDDNAKVGKKVTITYKYTDKNGNTDYYVMEGTLENQQGQYIVANPQFYSFLEYPQTREIKNILEEHFNKQLYNEGKVKQTINKEHPLFKQIKQMFVQELNDAANAINLIFENNNGIVNVDPETNEPVFREGYDNSKETGKRLYAVYHVGKDGTILTEKDVKGRRHLTGRVFGSDRFQITRDIDGKVEVRNYGQEIIDEAFDVLYGGASPLTLRTKPSQNGVVVDLNNEQTKTIEDKLSEFIIDYIQDTQRRLEQYREFIPSDYLIKDNVAEFALNHHIMFGNFNDLFEGDTKFYKDTQTFLKRAKESQASGTPYGNTNYAVNMLDEPKHVPSRLDTYTFNQIDANGNVTEVKFELKDKFTAVTVKNSIRNNKDLEVAGVDGAKKDGALVVSLTNAIIESLRKDGMKAKEAKAIATERARDIVAGVQRDGRHGYYGTKVNDAQSYITFEEWVRRITARGQLMKYKPLIEAILDETKPVDVKTIEQFVQVQKNFYYDQYYNSRTKTFAPRQIKNAEFVLVPRFIKGTQLERVYQLMHDNNIDQLNTEETSKAGKANVLSIWNNDGDITEDNIKDFQSRVKEASEYFSYNNLYTQQETPQHINAKNKAGIQIMKKILDNIDDNSWLGEIKRDFFKNYVANIKESYNDVIERLGIELDENGNIQIDETTGEIKGLDKQILFDMLKQEMIRQGLDSNSMDYVTLVDDEVSERNGITVVPTYFGNKSTKLESISQSIFNAAITRQKLPGFHAAQITSVGFTPLRDTISKRKYNDDLQYHPKEYQLKDSNTIITEREYQQLSSTEKKKYEYIGTANYIEIMLPASNFGINQFDKDGNPRSREDIIKELHDAGLDMMIGYRIPTEGKQSICIMKIVGFTDDAQGSTIVVPDMWVAQTGSDFDIDSVYGINFKARTNEETGRLEKIPYDFNNHDARNNQILQDMIEILSSDEAMEENLGRSNFEDIITARDNAINKSIKDLREARSPYNFLDQADYQEDVMSGAKLKAFSVTRDTFCSICNTVKPKLYGNNAVTMYYRKEDGYSFEQLKYAFDGVKEIKPGLYKVIHNTFGWSNNNRNVVGKLITSYSSQTTAHILDAVKEGAIPNVNDYTFQVYKMFPDLGSDYATGVSFIMLNGVSEIVKAYNENKSIYARNNSNPVNTAFKKVAKEFLKVNGVNIKDNASLAEYYQALAPFNKELAKLFNLFDSDFKIELSDKESAKLPISQDIQHRRLKGEQDFTSSPIGERNKLLYDLGTIIQFNHLNHIASNIGNYTRVCNPDKFGAKQTIFETEKIFDDIKNIITDDKKDILRVDRKNSEGSQSLLLAIYPGLRYSNNVDGFLEANGDEESAYPTLNAFLKYATATSVKINRTLFETQDKDFVSELNKIKDSFTNSQVLTQKIYKELQSYVLNYFYNRTDAVSKPVIYLKDKGFVWDKDGDYETERRRIYGYGKSSRLDVTTEDGSVVQFDVEDINNPSETEIKQFATLSPAQKVFWVQDRYEDKGVFKYLAVNLFNDKASGNINAGMQTLRYIENQADIDTVYNLFNQAFYNNNPLIAMTAMDIIKYAFVVEGYKMKRNAVNKMISNIPLVAKQEDGGTGIIFELNDIIGDIKNATINMNQVRENFIRSHSNMSQIATQRVEKNSKGLWELTPINSMIYFSNSKEDLELANKYGFIYDIQNGGFSVNRYIKLRFGRDLILYKVLCDYNTNEIIAIPLNKLEANENSDFSVNKENNNFNRSDYYESIAYDWFARTNTEEDIRNIIKAHEQQREQTKALKYAEINKGAITFDINEKGTVNTAGFESVIDKITNHFSQNVKEPVYFRAPALTKYIRYIGYSNGEVQTINGRKYYIYKFDARKWNSYITQNKSLSEKKLKSLNPTLQEVIRNAYNNNYVLNDVYVASPIAETTTVQIEEEEEGIDDGLMYSSVSEHSVVEFGSRFIDSVETDAINNNNQEAQKLVQYFRDKDITIAALSVEANTDDIIAMAAKYITENVEDILNTFKYFTTTIDTSNGAAQTIDISIDDIRAIDHIRNNPAERQRFLETLLKARAFIKNFNFVVSLNIDSEDLSTKNNFEKIKTAINSLIQSSLINKAEENFAEEYLAKLSDNPLFKQDIMNILDGYHSASALDAWINDMQETSNPLLQIVTKEVMSDIRSKEMKAYKEVEKIKAKIADIRKRAASAGITIDNAHIVDSEGKLVQDYTSALVDKIDALREAINAAKSAYGDGSIQHIEAVHEYNKFKLNHVHQELIDDYYQARLELDDYMIKNYPSIFEAYKQLDAQRREIFNRAQNGILEGKDLEDYKKVKQEITNLTSELYYDSVLDEWMEKKDGSDPTNPFRNNPKLLNIYNKLAAKALREYLEKNKEISNKYFRDESKYGFEEDLERNLEIVRSYEKRVNGRITTPANVLAMHDDYIKAKSWLETNTQWVVNKELDKKLKDAYKQLHEAKKGRAKLSKIVRDKNLYDSHGIIKADELSEADIDIIRQEQLDNYGLKEGQPWQDKSLISNAPTDDTVFETDFYRQMTSNGISNPDYIAKVQQINSILEKHYDSLTRTVYTSELTEDELRTLIDLYDEIEDLKKTTGSTNGKQVRHYIQNNVDFIIDDAKYLEQKRLIQNKDPRYKDLWSLLNERVEEVNGVDQVIPNKRLYGYAVPKGYKPDGTGNNSKVNKNKTEALRFIRSHTQTVQTTYYYKKFNEMSNKSEAEFNDWYYKNHVYNPYTRVFEPLSCWTTLKVISENPNEVVGEYIPSYHNRNSVPKDEYLNDKYKGKNSSTASNYKTSKKFRGIPNIDFSDGIDYSNNNAMNQYERELKELYEDIIRTYAQSSSTRKFFKQGYMIARAKKSNKDASFYAKEAAKLAGWIETATGKESWTKDEDVDYATDKAIDMPFATLLKNKDSKTISYNKPKREENESDADYKNRLKEWEDNNKAAKAENAKIHGELLDRDFDSVVEDFVLKATHYNAIQENKYLLFYAKNMLDRLEYYVKNTGFNDLQLDKRRSTEDQNSYISRKDTRLQEQYVNWIRRLVYDQWKKPNNKFTKYANIAQSLTSAKFMMLNVTGGIANITVGSTQIYAEMIANEYFGKLNAALGLSTWSANVGSFIADMYSDRASSVASAAIKFFNVVDFDELNGVVSVPDAEEYMKRARDIAYSPQATGEHMMQNGALFSMCHSHRLVANPNAKYEGRLSYRLMNEAEYLREADEQALFDIMTDEERKQFEEFKELELKDPNKAKEYAWFRKYLTVEFANLYLDNERKREYIKQRRKRQAEKKEEFNNDENHPTLYSQFKLDNDGKLGFVDGSKLAEMGDEAYKLLGAFKGRVISVNKKIHGVYDKLGAAQLEKYWFGSLVMQYHKHIYPGVMKRYRRQGYFNEERGTIEKGCYAAIKDFLALPLHKAQFAKKLQRDNNMSDEELSSVKGIQNIVKNYVEFATHVRLYWNIIPENERGNIKRALGDFAGALGAVCTAIALRCLADDKEDSLVYNLMMYESDRLASESMMYNPFGLISEGKKLWSSPVAVQGAITDMFHTVGFISQYIIQGDEFDDTYQNGMYAGEHKMSVFIKRNIPIYHGIYMMERLNKSNRYYKLGENMLSIIPVKDIAEFITD